ncbi:MAG: hypothetical protein E6J89_06820 [Deltaproteobacteria bacterium]|nr:MAG: hypothetical protein E6J89_06820 [Deltaproteobacteria bacterium]
MTGREVLKENEGILKSIIRSIDKNLDYTVVDSTEAQGARFSLQLTLRGRHATVSLSIDDLRLAGADAVRRNAVRQKMKSTRDHMMDNHLPDVLGSKIAKMLKASAATQESFQHSAFRRSPRR